MKRDGRRRRNGIAPCVTQTIFVLFIRKKKSYNATLQAVDKQST